MFKTKVFTDILKIAFAIYIALVALFIILIVVDYSLLLGWLIGSFSSMFSFCIGAYVTEKIFKKNDSKLNGFWKGILRTWIQVVFHAVMLMVLIAVNSYCSDASFFRGGLDSIISPINFFTYLGGISLISISTIISIFVTKKRDKEK